MSLTQTTALRYSSFSSGWVFIAGDVANYLNVSLPLCWLLENEIFWCSRAQVVMLCRMGFVLFVRLFMSGGQGARYPALLHGLSIFSYQSADVYKHDL